MTDPLQHPLAHAIHEFMERAEADPDVDLSDDAFNSLALGLHDWQRRHNPLLGALHPDPARPSHWTRIPPVPVAAFREQAATCLPPALRQHAFVSSGTTSATRSRHWHHTDSLALYEHAVQAGFRSLADVSLTGMRTLLLTPNPEEAPDSSLVHMGRVLARASAGGARFLGRVDPFSGDWHLPLATTVRTLAEESRSGRPLLLFGTAFHYVHVTDHLERSGRRLSLPQGSWVLETGGYKGRSRSLPAPLLHERIRSFLGVSPDKLLCEYGMCELGSQAYARPISASPGPALFRFPSWVRSMVVSPETERPVAPGETGLLQVLDLANAWSALCIRTEDLARRRDTGFELVGRVKEAAPRGCSLNLAANSLVT